MKELKEKLERLLKQTRDIAAKAEAENRDFTADERTEVQRLLDEAKGVKAQIDEKQGDDALRKAMSDLGADIGIIDPSDPQSPVAAGKGNTLGERFVNSSEFSSWLKSIAPNGNISEKAKGLISPPVMLGSFKDIITGGDPTSGGALVVPDRRTLVELPFRPLTIRDVITIGQTGSDSVEYPREVSRTSGAAPVPEATGTAEGDQVGDEPGIKPQSSFVLEKVSTPVKTVAHWMPATKKALSDAGQLRTLIDNFLRQGLEEEVEDQVVAGDGLGENFTGILNTTGTQTQGFDTNIFVTTRKALTKVRVVGRARPTAYLLNPTDVEAMDLLVDGNDRFFGNGPFGFGPRTLWGVPIVETEAIPAGTGLVGDLRTCVLWDREQASIQVSDSHADFFIRNMVAILAELRAAFGVLRPAALVEIDTAA
jgi:HK97 family phage major capsid protein